MADGDPEDLPAQPAELRQVDRSLRCAICYDLYSGPVVLACGHSFCSRCIRDSFNVRIRDGQTPVCPSCRKPCDQADLRPIVHLREASTAWRVTRQHLLQRQQQLQVQQQQQQADLVQQAVAQQRRQQQQQRLQQQHAQQPFNRSSNLSRGIKRSVKQQQPPSHRQAAAAPSAMGSRSRTNTPAPEAAITVSSNGPQDSGASITDESDGQAADSQAADPDWQSQDSAEAPALDPVKVAAPSKHQLRNSTSSSTGAARSASPTHVHAGAGCDSTAAAVVGEAAGEANEPFEQPSKRPRTSLHNNTGIENKASQRPAVPGQQEGSSKPQPQLQPGYVSCPICSMSVKESFVNSHIDSCLSKQEWQQQAAFSTRPAASDSAAAGAARASSASKARQKAAADATASRTGAAATVEASATGADKEAHGSRSGIQQASRPNCGVARKSKGKAASLEAPPKLCFELMKDRELKSKLAALRLSTDGAKKVCAERYASFRNYVLSLKDSSSNLSLAEAAAEFTRSQQRIARASARPQAVGPSSGAPAGLSNRAEGANGAATADADMATHDNSYATLIQETKARMAQRKQQQQQQPQQETPQQPKQQQDDLPPDQQQQQDMQRPGYDLRQQQLPVVADDSAYEETAVQDTACAQLADGFEAARVQQQQQPRDSQGCINHGSILALTVISQRSNPRMTV